MRSSQVASWVALLGGGFLSLVGACGGDSVDLGDSNHPDSGQSATTGGSTGPTGSTSAGQGGATGASGSTPVGTSSGTTTGEGGASGGSGTGGASAGAGGSTGGSAGSKGTGAGGGSAGSKGTGGAGNGGSGTGADGGESCEQLVMEYDAALKEAQVCKPGGTNECQATAYVSFPCHGCMTHVQDATTLQAIDARWSAAGCKQGICPAIACLPLGMGRCVANDGSAAGTCSGPF